MVEFQEDLLRFFKGRTSVGNPFRNGSGEWYNPHEIYKIYRVCSSLWFEKE
ncbi:hypothetical protein [Bartonella sp. CL71SXKL]|uniref:hypothetical protein n=1 Tax=Bartonella sp. CL71SXKL TaxID=3243540 RepID=UPI0035D01C22